MSEYCNKCEKCRFKCKTSDKSKADKCVMQDTLNVEKYNVFFEENKIDKRRFAKDNNLKLSYFNKMLKGEIEFDERYEACIKKMIDKYDEFEPYKAKFEGGEQNL